MNKYTSLGALPHMLLNHEKLKKTKPERCTVGWLVAGKQLRTAMSKLQKRTDEAGKADKLTLKLWLRLLEGKGLSEHKWTVDKGRGSFCSLIKDGRSWEIWPWLNGIQYGTQLVTCSGQNSQNYNLLPVILQKGRVKWYSKFQWW